MSRSGGLFVWALNKHELILTMSALSLVTELFTKVVDFFGTFRLRPLGPDGSHLRRVSICKFSSELCVHSIIAAIISSYSNMTRVKQVSGPLVMKRHALRTPFLKEVRSFILLNLSEIWTQQAAVKFGTKAEDELKATKTTCTDVLVFDDALNLCWHIFTLPLWTARFIHQKLSAWFCKIQYLLLVITEMWRTINTTKQ